MKHNTPLHIVLICLIFPLCLLTGCGEKDLPIDKIKNALRDAPTYSIILEDMKEEGTFSKNYYHKYRIIQVEDAWTTDWFEVPKNYYMMNERFLGMTLAGKKDGEAITSVSPPGYNYVGDPRYGHWRTDSSGNSFWEFYGKYALFSHFMGGWYRPIYRNDYDMYRSYRSRNAPYFGRNNQYGTSGSVAKQTRPDFFRRKMQAQQSSRKTFTDKVAKRVGRTKTGFRSRAGGYGK